MLRVIKYFLILVNHVCIRLKILVWHIQSPKILPYYMSTRCSQMSKCAFCVSKEIYHCAISQQTYVQRVNIPPYLSGQGTKRHLKNFFYVLTICYSSCS